jgi:hypothetical protein
VFDAQPDGDGPLFFAAKEADEGRRRWPRRLPANRRGAADGAVGWSGEPGSKSDNQCSPTAADGKISVMNFNADVSVIQAGGSEFTLLPTANFQDDGDRTRHRASEAISPGSRFVRTGTKLFAFGQ